MNRDAKPIRSISALVQKVLGTSVLLLVTGITQSAVSSEGLNAAVAPSLKSALVPSSEPFVFAQMRDGSCSSSVKGTTESSMSESGLTIPSFWWLRDEISAQAQFGRRLIDRWLACPGTNGQSNRVDFLVNQQVWSLLDYLERYQFVHRLGTVAGDYRHNVRVFNRQGTLLAAYTCAFNTDVAKTEETIYTLKSDKPKSDKPKSDKLKSQASLACSLALDSTGKFGIRGRTSPDGLLPRENGSVRP
ncbi:MAG: hypothetical protein KME13_14000 [Myxacorys californica WJT36-NPBG1]|jgi:hypothetical protein|nr:hypothetical protein [Myxacorys californica WJT36-NPBG1]